MSIFTSLKDLGGGLYAVAGVPKREDPYAIYYYPTKFKEIDRLENAIRF